jgi:hypothetical protein
LAAALEEQPGLVETQAQLEGGQAEPVTERAAMLVVPLPTPDAWMDAGLDDDVNARDDTNE